MDPQSLAKKLRQLREERGLKQEEIEKAIDLPQKACTHIEAGTRKVSTLELAKLAELFHVPISDFFISDQKEEDLIVALHRALPGLKRKHKMKDEIARCMHLCREAVFLERLIGAPRQAALVHYSFSVPRTVLEAISQGENAAQQERYRLELGKGAIYDIVEPLSSQGIRVVGTQFPDEISGLFLNHSSMGMVILVNASHERTRQRFSYAHEYAHALFDQRRTVIISNADNASELVEVRANAFAAAFLMPKEGVEGLLRSMGKGGAGRNYLAVFDAIQEKVMEAQYRQPAASQKISAQVVAWIAYRFGVSFQVAVYRLQNLNCLKPHERDELLKAEQQGREYMRVLHLQDDSLTPQKLQDKELKASVARLAIEAYQREDISRGRLLDISKLLGLKGAQLLELAYTDPS